ncbi:hypothetical protein acsn021_15460 [Anaerocolumna cellulosilytica]|uniref:Stage 0 sporulation protein A homolog n=1 Tax=Anaerocolumna cellulosilytica TaxID=433286 RepID=A0A6S6R1N7_9FIRM|nr:LytTR family DNA-binding domain-containing protein [Anaerocolumna cellulosilytica]MBB5196715.1 DNA-binding LytR/AlgR family response regulator [Anaerocolumna cellulosilytica]BCJ93977.1 hypothetical protein acsn021_15460 [Anaerocolumna cellulosilytica]
MIKIAIVDDVKANIDCIEREVENFFSNKSIPFRVSSYENSRNFLYDIQENQYFDICFLDIKMPNIDGIELAKTINKTFSDCYVLFITSHMEYAIEGYELHIYRYIPKTLIDKKLPIALRDLITEIMHREKESYIIKTHSRFEKIFYKDIYYIFKDRKNSIFVTASGESRERKSISDVYRDLNSDEFLIIDRGFIVNTLHVMKINNNLVILRNGISLSISRSHINDVKKKINQFWRVNV